MRTKWISREQFEELYPRVLPYKDRKEKQMTDLYTMFKDWLGYEWPQVEFTVYQEKVLRTLLEEGVPRTKAELAARLKELLPKARK